jgi:accessory gene regulator B
MRDPIDALADHISLSIKRANPEETIDVEIMSYSLSLIINMVLTTAFILGIGAFTNTFRETLAVIITFAVLRFTAKGFHFKSLTVCVVATTALLASIPHIPVPESLMLPMLCLCVLLVLWKSNANMTMKCVALAVMALAFSLRDPAMMLSCLAYAITLVPERR